MRIIDADVLRELAFECDEWWENADVWIVDNLIDSVPTIYEHKEGKWIVDNNFESDMFGDCKCSECGEWQNDKTNYCPACGAKMVDAEEWEFRSEWNKLKILRC